MVSPKFLYALATNVLTLRSNLLVIPNSSFFLVFRHFYLRWVHKILWTRIFSNFSNAFKFTDPIIQLPKFRSNSSLRLHPFDRQPGHGHFSGPGFQRQQQQQAAEVIKEKAFGAGSTNNHR